MLALLILVIAMDVALVFAFFKLNRKQEAHQSILRELSEERLMLNDLRNSTREEFKSAQMQLRTLKEQVQYLATEAEQEVKNGVATISAEVEAMISTLTTRFDEPLSELTSKQHYLESLLQRIQAERKTLAQTTERAGAIAKLLKKGANIDDVLKELEDKKFTDIRSMVARGLHPTAIASDLGISEQEVKLVAGLR
jgi:chromosome segregation ATPase